MKTKFLGLALLILSCGPAVAAETGPVATARAQPAPSAYACAAVYGALAEGQGNFGTTDSLMGERYFNYARIDFQDRLAQLAGKAEVGITELQDASASERSELYMKLVDAETEGDLDTAEVRAITHRSDGCDAEFGFTPSLGN